MGPAGGLKADEHRGLLCVLDLDGDDAQHADEHRDEGDPPGVPLGEPVVSSGPFVMNTGVEIYRAIQDYQSGRMGHLS